MLHPDIDHLSLWEVANRWHGMDPNTSDPKNLPLSVQDTLRTLTRMQFRHEIPVCNKNGVVLKDERTLVDFENYVDLSVSRTDVSEHQKINEETGDPMAVYVSETYEDPEIKRTDDERWESYAKFSANWLRRHSEATKTFPECFENRVYDRQILDQTYIDKEAVREACESIKRPLPTFWFNEHERSAHEANLKGEGDQDSVAPINGRIKQDDIDRFWSKLADKQKHRVLCREIAQALWKESPNLSIADICKHEAIRRFGGGRYYSKPDTLREWIKDLDPRPEESKKGGRPRS